MPAVSMEQKDLLLKIYVQPKASRDQIVGIHGDELKIVITAPPIDGKANAYLQKYFSKIFKVPKGNIAILKGELGRHKLIKVISPRMIPEEIDCLLTLVTTHKQQK